MPSWEERFKNGEHSGMEPDPFLAEAVEGRVPGRALDLACGRGRHSFYLAQVGWVVDAWDSSPTALSGIEHPSIHTRLVDLEAEGFALPEDSWSLIVDSLFFHRPLFSSLPAALQPGGLFVGIFPVKNVRPRFIPDPRELLSIFATWRVLHHREEDKLFFALEKPS